MTVIPCRAEALEVRESVSEVLRRLQNSTIAAEVAPGASGPVAQTGSFAVTAADRTPLVVPTASVLFVRAT